jgi:hypothetical protein
MYPPKVEDEQIRALIHELSVGGKLPSGAALRAALAQRYRSRGGVSRIYWLLGEERKASGSVVSSATDVTQRLLEQENRNLREQLMQLRQREDAHQVYWNREVAQLRERVQALATLLQQAVAAGEVPDALRQEVHGADVRAGQLDVVLRAFGPATGRTQSSD